MSNLYYGFVLVKLQLSKLWFFISFLHLFWVSVWVKCNPNQQERMAHTTERPLSYCHDVWDVCRRHQSDQVPHCLSSGKSHPTLSIPGLTLYGQRFVDLWILHPNVDVPQTDGPDLGAHNCIERIKQSSNLTIPLCIKQAPLRHNLPRLECKWKPTEYPWDELECWLLPRSPWLTTVPDLTSSYVAEWANLHSHTLKANRKPSQKIGGHYNSKTGN